MTKQYIVGAFVACCLSAITVAALFSTAERGDRPSQIIGGEIPEEYRNIATLLKDYQNGVISTEYVIQIMLMREIENEGIFLHWKDVDTFGDRVLVHKKTRERELEYKKLRYQQIEQRAR